VVFRALKKTLEAPYVHDQKVNHLEPTTRGLPKLVRQPGPDPQSVLSRRVRVKGNVQ